MVTLKEFSWEIIRILSGGQQSKDTEYDVRYVSELIRTAMNEVIPMEVIRKRSLADDRTAIRMYIASYPNIKIQYDDATNRSYANIPEFYQSMVYGKGVYGVSFMDKPYDPMIPQHNPEVSSRISAGSLQGKVGYSVEGYKIWWNKKMGGKGKDAIQVLIRLVVAAPDTIGLDDNLPIIPEQKALIQDRVLQWIRQEGIQDKIADENKDLNVRV